jgi:hypothetical protein
MKPVSEMVAGKVIYLVSKSASDALAADRHRELKVVAAGMKAFERKVGTDGNVEYRLMQEGIQVLAPYIAKRKVEVTIQDFCNLLGAGQVTLSTMSATTTARILQEPPGILILVYCYRPEDVMKQVEEQAMVDAESDSMPVSSYKEHIFYMMCWKGSGHAVNVTCKKIGELWSLITL